MPRSTPSKTGTARATILAVLVLAMTAGSGYAQRITFEPRLALSYIYRNNVEFVGNLDAGDSSLRLSLLLPVTRTTRKGTTSFGYRGHIERFDEFTSFDDVGHRVSLGYQTSPEARSSFSISTGYTRTQDQSDPTSEDVSDEFLTRRVRRERIHLDAAFGRSLRNRWHWLISGGVGRWSYSRVVGEEEDETPVGLEDRNEGRARFMIGRDLSRASSLGVAVGVRRYDLDVSGESDAVLLSLVYGHRIAEKMSLSVSVGGFATRRNKADPETGSEQTRTGGQGSLSLSRNFRRTTLVLSASHQPDVGGARIGTSVNTRFHMTLADTFHRNWGWSFHARYSIRDPNEDIQPRIDVATAGAGLQFRLLRRVGLRLSGAYIDQGREDRSERDQYYRVIVSFSGHVRGWTKDSGAF